MTNTLKNLLLSMHIVDKRLIVVMGRENMARNQSD